MGFIVPSISEVLTQNDKVKRLSSHRQHLTPSSPVNVDLLGEAFPMGLDWVLVLVCPFIIFI